MSDSTSGTQAGTKSVNWGRLAWTVLRVVFGLFFLITGVAIVVARTTGLISEPVQPTAAAADFMAALGRTPFMDLLTAASYIAGGGALLLDRTAPLGIAILAPTVTVILFFHLFLSGQYIWGPFVAAYFALLVWRYRRGFKGLWSYSDRA
jgi:cytochrome b subunit of formate dehydrogenase